MKRIVSVKTHHTLVAATYASGPFSAAGAPVAALMVDVSRVEGTSPKGPVSVLIN